MRAGKLANSMRLALRDAHAASIADRPAPRVHQISDMRENHVHQASDKRGPSHGLPFAMRAMVASSVTMNPWSASAASTALRKKMLLRARRYDLTKINSCCKCPADAAAATQSVPRSEATAVARRVRTGPDEMRDADLFRDKLRSDARSELGNAGSQIEGVNYLAGTIVVDLSIEAEACGKITHGQIPRHIDGEHTLDPALTRYLDQVSH